MLRTMRSPSIFKKINLVLMKGADKLTGNDLVRIAQVAEQAGAVIYVSLPSWQVLLAVPVMQQQQVSESLHERGYDSARVTRKLDRDSTLQLRGRGNEVSLHHCRTAAGSSSR